MMRHSIRNHMGFTLTHRSWKLPAVFLVIYLFFLYTPEVQKTIFASFPSNQEKKKGTKGEVKAQHVMSTQKRPFYDNASNLKYAVLLLRCSVNSPNNRQEVHKTAGSKVRNFKPSVRMSPRRNLRGCACKISPLKEDAK